MNLSVVPLEGGSIGGGLQKLEWGVISNRKHGKSLGDKFSVLKDMLSLVTCETHDVDDLKRNIDHLVECYPTKGDLPLRAERGVIIFNENVGAPLEHIKNLIMHLKHEVIYKAQNITE